MSTSYEVGRVQPLFKGQYGPSITYFNLDNVLNNGSTWVCTVPSVSGVEPSAGASQWKLVAAAGSQGPTPTIVCTASAHTVSADASAVAAVTSTGVNAFRFSFDIPAGPTGESGLDSVAATVTNYRAGSTSEKLISSDPPWVSASFDSNAHSLTLDFGLPPGADGAGGVSYVDGVGSEEGNVPLNAIRYASQSLTPTQQETARNNIGLSAISSSEIDSLFA